MAKLLRPSDSVDIRDVRGRKIGDVGVIREKTENALNGRNYGGMGLLLIPSASVSFRGRQRTSALFEAGRWKMGNY